jgi:hypothetical protein
MNVIINALEPISKSGPIKIFIYKNKIVRYKVIRKTNFNLSTFSISNFIFKENLI